VSRGRRLLALLGALLLWVPAGVGLALAWIALVLTITTALLAGIAH
jgi:hypothetical protein